MEQDITDSVNEKEIRLIGQDSFAIDGDVHRLVTFLNQSLKDRDLIFGLSKQDERLCLRIYEVVESSLR